MIVYQADKRQFIRDNIQDDIEDVLAAQYLRTTGRKAQPAGFRAWANSLFEVGEVLKDPGIPDDMGVALKYTVTQSAKPIDLLLTSEDAASAPRLKVHM